MNLNDIRKDGYERGWNVASWQDMPALGDELPREMDWVGVGTIDTIEKQIEAFEICCSEAESNNRQYSPFEFTAHEINSSKFPDEYWEAFDEGISAGIKGYRRKHWSKRKLKEWNKP